MQTITAKDVKFGFGRLIDLAHGEPMRIAKNGRPEPLIRMLDYAQKWTAAIDWQSVEEIRRIRCAPDRDRPRLSATRFGAPARPA